MITQTGTDQPPSEASPSPFAPVDCLACGTPTPRLLLLPYRVEGRNYPICPGCHDHQEHLVACDGCDRVYPEQVLMVNDLDTTTCPACLREWLALAPPHRHDGHDGEAAGAGDSRPVLKVVPGGAA